MGLFGAIGGLIGGASAANKIKDSARAGQNFATDNFNQQKTELRPFLDAGSEGVNFLRDLMSGGSVIGDSGEAILSNVLKDVTGQLGAQGMSDSGFARNALFDTALRAREGIRSRRFGEGSTLASIGSNAISQLIGAGGQANNAFIGAQNQMGQASAFNAQNKGNMLGGIADGVLGAFL